MAPKVSWFCEVAPPLNPARGNATRQIGDAAGEENYRQLISRVKSRQDAILALNILDQGRKERAVLQQHVPFTFHTSQALIRVRILHFYTAIACGITLQLFLPMELSAASLCQ